MELSKFGQLAYNKLIVEINPGPVPRSIPGNVFLGEIVMKKKASEKYFFIEKEM